MAWIRTIVPEAAQGLLAQLYAAAVARAGRVAQIIQLQSLRPRVLQASTQLYRELMFPTDARPRSERARSLSRVQREMIAVTVSVTNDCHY